MKEIEFQRHLIKAAQAEGGYGLKLSNQFQVGIPDLLIKLPEYPVTIVECKVLSVAVINMSRNYINQVTAVQRLNLRLMKKSGVIVGVVILVEEKSTYKDKAIMARTDFTADRFHLSHGIILKEFRQPWPIRKIISELQKTTMENSTGPWSSGDQSKL